MPNFTIVAVKMCTITAPKIAKNGNFWYKFAPNEKFWGSTEKVEYRCTTTNLCACNDTIFVLKITLLHSVSVITNFVIPKRDKQTKNITLFRLQPACDPRSSLYLAIWRPSAILNLNFVILYHRRSQLCGSIALSKFGVDPIFPAGDIAIL